MFSIDMKSVAIGAVIVAVAAMVFVVSFLSNLFSLKDAVGAFLFPPTTAEVLSSRTIVGSLQPLGQLVSLSVEVAKADIQVTVSSGAMNICGHSANHVAQGVIEAGVDITRVSEDSVVYDAASNTYTISLPAPQITSCRIEYIRQYEQNGGNPTCGIDWDNVRLLGQYVATQDFSADALDADILARAERETTILMRSFVGALTGANVEIVYAEADAVLPASCIPQLPNGWRYDETLASWVQES